MASPAGPSASSAIEGRIVDGIQRNSARSLPDKPNSKPGYLQKALNIPKLTVSKTSTPTSSPDLRRDQQVNLTPQLTPNAGRSRSRSPQIRRQLVLRTSRSPSPSLAPHTLGRHSSSPALRLHHPSDTGSNGKTSISGSEGYMSTVFPPGRSASSANIVGERFQYLPDRTDSRSLPPNDTFAYANRGFHHNDELILHPSNLWPRGMEDGEMGEDEAFVDEMVVIERPIYSQKDFDQGFEGGKRPARNARTWLRSKAQKCECSCACVRKFFVSHLPFLGILRDYSIKRDLMSDIIAGLTVGIMHIPQGMAYGQLSTLPPVYGLYVSFFPVVLYFFLGTSKHVSIGTFAVVSLMVGSAVDKGMKNQNLVPMQWNVTESLGGNLTTQLMDNSAEILDTKLKLAMAVTFAVGILQLLLGILRLGFLTVYLSDPLISGFTTGAACHVFTSQIKHIFGISMGRYSGAFKLIFSYRDIFMNLPETNAVTFIASIVCMVLLFVVKEYISPNPKIKAALKMPIPIELIVVVLGTVISYFVQLEEVYEVKIVGDIPTGIPPPNLKAFKFLSDVATDAIAIGIVAFAISVSMAKIFAKKHDYEVDSNQELLAYGLCNIFSSFFSSFVSAVSLSRSLVQENVGGKTQITGLVSSCLLVVVLLVVGPYFSTLPNCVLAAIILVALKGMFKQFGELKALWSISVIDFAVWLVTFAATVLLDVDLGLLVGVGFALLTVIIRSQRPYSCLLGQVPGTDIYKDLNVYKIAEETPNIKIFRFDSALFFANTEFFKSSLYKLTVDPSELKKKQRKLNKKKRKEEKELLDVAVDSVGSTKLEEDSGKKATSVSENENDRTPQNSPVPPSPRPDGSRTGNRSPAAPPSTGAASSSVEDEDDPNHVKEFPTITDVHFIILDCSTMSYVDSMGVKVLQQIITELRTFNVTVYLAQCKSSVREMFERTNFYKTGSKQFLFVTIHDAVVSAQLHQWSILGENPPPSTGNNNNNIAITIGGDTDTVDGDEEKEEEDRNESNAKTDSNGGTEQQQQQENQDKPADSETNNGNGLLVERTEF